MSRHSLSSKLGCILKVVAYFSLHQLWGRRWAGSGIVISVLPVRSLIPSTAQTGRGTCSKLAEELVLRIRSLQKSLATFTAPGRRFLKGPRGGAVEQTVDSNTPAFNTPSSWAHLRPEHESPGDLATLDSVGPRGGQALRMPIGEG